MKLYHLTELPEKESASMLSRRQLLAALGGAGAAAAAQSLMSGPVFGDTVSGAVYGYSGAAPCCRPYAAVSDMQADGELEDGMLVRTFGYYEPGDGGAADYAIRNGSLPVDNGSVIALSGGLQALLLPGAAIRYKQFGAVGDGVNDDGVQVKHAHAYANSRRLPVNDEAGEYWLKETNRIVVQTNVRWGHTRFHIEERYNTTSEPKFVLASRYSPQTIQLAPAEKASLLARLKPGTTMLPELAAYKNCLIFVTDSQDKIGLRYGQNANSGWNREEFFYVEEHGRIIGDIAWTFQNYTSLVAYPCDEDYLTVEGGAFLLSGDSPGGPAYEGYWHNGFLIARSRTIIRGQWVGLEQGQADTALNPRHGFYTFQRVYDVVLEHVRLLPFEKDREDPNAVVPQGTYGIGGSRALHVAFRHLTAEGSRVHWGVFGTNLFKNFYVENCRLNRVDVHFHCWNLYIKDCEIGYKGFTLTGGGDLVIENTRRYGNQFVSFRRDYGAKWDGPIRISGCRLVVENGASEVIALDFNPYDFDHRYPIGYGTSVRIDDLIFDYTGLAATGGVCRVMRIASFSKLSTSPIRIFFPQLVEFRHIRVVGREKGVRLLNISNPFSFDCRKPGGIRGQRFAPNCVMRFAHIQGEKVPRQAPQSNTHVNFLLGGSSTAPYEDDYALYPKIELTEVGDFFGHFKGAAADVRISGSTVNCVDAYDGGPMRGRLVLEHCDLQPDAADDGGNFYSLSAKLGVTLIDCTLHAPIVDGAERPDLLNRFGFLEWNAKLLHNHLNTKLASSLTDYWTSQGEPVAAEFYAMLQSHHAAESTWMARRRGTTAQRPDGQALQGATGALYFDTELEQLLLWDGVYWTRPVQRRETLHFYAADLPSATAGDRMKRAEAHPLQLYVAPRGGKVTGYTAYADVPAVGSPSFTFELWKNGTLWLSGLDGPSQAANPLAAGLPGGGSSFSAGDRIEARIGGVSPALASGASATVDVLVQFDPEPV